MDKLHRLLHMYVGVLCTCGSACVCVCPCVNVVAICLCVCVCVWCVHNELKTITYQILLCCNSIVIIMCMDFFLFAEYFFGGVCTAVHECKGII